MNPTIKYYGIVLNSAHVSIEDLSGIVSELNGYTPRKDAPNCFDGPDQSIVRVVGHDLQTDIEIDTASLEASLKIRNDLNKQIGKGLNLR